MEKNLGVTKKILHSGRCGCTLDYPKETKFIFHYQVRKTDDDRTVLDDSRKYGKTMELYSGKKFQLEVWELCLETMIEGEVASFVVEKRHLGTFPAVNKKLRDFMTEKAARGEAKHCCGMMALQEQGGLGYKDLDELMANPQDLDFIFELIRTERPEQRDSKESWLMSNEERLAAVDPLREAGNQLYKAGDLKGAVAKYGEAYHHLDQLILMEKPGDEEWHALNQRKLPLLLNLAQCKLLLKEFYESIKHSSEALEIDPDNVKGLFRRAKAYVAVWDFAEARSDFERVQRLDAGMARAVAKELTAIDRLEREKMAEERSQLMGKLF